MQSEAKDAASAAICYVRTTTGGAGKTLEYAKKRGFKIINAAKN